MSSKRQQPLTREATVNEAPGAIASGSSITTKEHKAITTKTDKDDGAPSQNRSPVIDLFGESSEEEDGKNDSDDDEENDGDEGDDDECSDICDSCKAYPLNYSVGTVGKMAPNVPYVINMAPFMCLH